MKMPPLRLSLFVVSSSLLLSRVAVYGAMPTPATPAQAADWKEHGRTLPTPELLQPTLDPALPAYVPRRDVALAGHFKGAASDVLALLTKNWIAAFQKYYPDVTIDLPPPYAGSLGAIELIKGDLDFVMVSRELKPTDISDFRKKFSYDPTSVPISGGTYRHFGFLDAIGVFVHEDNPLKHLTFAQLDAIYSSTRHRGGAEITTWGQLGLTGEWADKPIHRWGVKPWNGFEEFVRQRVLSVGDGSGGLAAAKRGEWRDDISFVDTVFPIWPAVAKDRYAIGYAGLAYVAEGVKFLGLSPTGSAPFFAPGYEEVARANYPLSRLCFMNFNRTPGQIPNPVLGEFLKFILSREGQRVIHDQAIFLPLRETQAAASRAQLK